MSLIVCAQNCRHQSDGYCQLNSVTSLSGSNDAKCGYYEQLAKTDEPDHSTDSSPENTQSIR